MEEVRELAVLLAIVFVVFCIPLSHSATYFGYDPFFYLMMTTEILKTGSISAAYNHPPLYPTTFSLLTILSGVDPFYLIRFSLPFIITFLGASAYLFAREMTNHRIALLTVIFLCLTSGYNFHWFYQFHVNFLEHRPAYLSWAFNFLTFYATAKCMKRKNNYFLPGIFMVASLFTYFLSSALTVISVFIFFLICFLKKRISFKNAVLPFLLVGFIFGPFFVSNLKNILEIIEMEKVAILRARTYLDYFEFLGFPAIFGLLGVLYSIKKRRYVLPLVWFFITMIYAQLYWIDAKLAQLSELVIRDLKAPVSFFAALGTVVLLEKMKNKRLNHILLITMLLLSIVPAIYGIMITQPFSYNEKIPFSAFEFLKNLPNGTIVSDEFTSMQAYDFANKDVIAGMYPKAGNFSVKRDDQKYIQQQLEENQIIDTRAEELIKNYNVKYFILNFGIWGKIERGIDKNKNWDKIFDSDEASVFILRNS